MKQNEKKKIAELSAGGDAAAVNGSFLAGDGRRGGRHGRGLHLGRVEKGSGIYNELLGGKGRRGY